MTAAILARKASGGPRAMGRVFDLMLHLARHQAGLTLTELSEALSVSKSTLLDTLRGLTQSGHLLAEGTVYRLGPAAYRLAGTIMASWSMPDIVHHHVRDLARHTRESVGYAVADWEIGQAIYTDAMNSTQPVHYAMKVGIRAPLYASAAGRVLLAFSSEERTRAYLSSARRKPLTESTRTTPDAILANLRTIRAQGYCASFGEMLKDTAALAVPVFDPAGQLTGALMIAAPLARMKANQDMLLAKVLAAGRAASGRAALDDELPPPESPSPGETAHAD